MIKYIHTVSAIAFYVLGSSFFLAYLFLHSNILTIGSMQWLGIADMPLLFTGMLYGGLSVYNSINDNNHAYSRALALSIGVPLVVLFLTLFVLNF